MEKRLLLPLIFLCALIMPNGVLRGAEEKFTPEKIATECETLKPDALQPYLDKIIEHINKKEFELPLSTRFNLCSKILEQLVVSKTENGKYAFRALYKLIQEKVNFSFKDSDSIKIFKQIWPKLQNNDALQIDIFTITVENLPYEWMKDNFIIIWLKELSKKSHSTFFTTYFKKKICNKKELLLKFSSILVTSAMDECFENLFAASKYSWCEQLGLLDTFWENISEKQRIMALRALTLHVNYKNAYNKKKLSETFTSKPKFFDYYLPRATEAEKEQENLLPTCPSLAELIKITEKQPVETKAEKKTTTPSLPVETKAEKKPAEPSFFDSYLTRAICAFASVVSGFFMGGLWDSISQTACFKKYPTYTALGCGAVGLTCVVAGHYGARRFTQKRVGSAKKLYN